MRLARRYEQLEAEAKEFELQISSLVREVGPELLRLVGAGPEVAATMLVTCGDNPNRLHSGASFATCAGSHPSTPRPGDRSITA